MKIMMQMMILNYVKSIEMPNTAQGCVYTTTSKITTVVVFRIKWETTTAVVFRIKWVNKSDGSDIDIGNFDENYDANDDFELREVNRNADEWLEAMFDSDSDNDMEFEGFQEDWTQNNFASRLPSFNCQYLDPDLKFLAFILQKL
jgi:hypothetical protein